MNKKTNKCVENLINLIEENNDTEVRKIISEDNFKSDDIVTIIKERKYKTYLMFLNNEGLKLNSKTGIRILDYMTNPSVKNAYLREFFLNNMFDGNNPNFKTELNQNNINITNDGSKILSVVFSCLHDIYNKRKNRQKNSLSSNLKATDYNNRLQTIKEEDEKEIYILDSLNSFFKKNPIVRLKNEKIFCDKCIAIYQSLIIENSINKTEKIDVVNNHDFENVTVNYKI